MNKYILVLSVIMLCYVSITLIFMSLWQLMHSVLELNCTLYFALHIVHYHLKEDPLQEDQGMSTNLMYNNFWG